MALHTTDKNVLGHIADLVAEEKQLYAEKDMPDDQRNAWPRSMSKSTAAGICCGSAARCASSAVIPTRPTCVWRA